MTPMRARRQMAIAVDDVGLHPGIGGAVLALARLGRVQAAGCLVGGAHWRGVAPALRALHRGQTEIGLHLDFTEAPQRMQPARALPLLWCASYARTLSRMAVADEIDAQLDAFEDAIGRPPDFVDGHQHVHQLPVIRDVLLDRLRRRGATCRPWLRSTRRPSGASDKNRLDLTGIAQNFKPWLIERLGATALAEMARTAGLPQNHALLGCYDFRGSRERYARLLKGWLQAAGDRDLLMTHPCEAASEGDPLGLARQTEFHLLTSEPFGQWLDEEAIELITVGSMRSQPSGSNEPSIKKQTTPRNQPHE